MSLLRSAASLAGAAAKQKGAALEERVARLLKADGKTHIRRNVMLRDSNGNASEVDVVYGRWFPVYVECKAYAPDYPVPLEDVAKFKSVLQLNGHAVRRSVFITTSTFSPRAKTLGIRTVDGKQLSSWETHVLRKVRLRAALRSFASGCVVAATGLALAVGFAPQIVEIVASHRRERGLEDGSLLSVLLGLRSEVVDGWSHGRLSHGNDGNGGNGGIWSNVWDSLWGQRVRTPPDVEARPLARAAYECAMLSSLVQSRVEVVVREARERVAR